MRPEEHLQELEAWLRAENDGRQEDADRLLRHVMASVPRLTPAAGFAGRAVAASRVFARAAAGGMFARWWVRGLVGVAMVLMALAAASASWAGLVSAGVVGVQGAAHGIALAWDWTASWAVTAWSVWTVLAQIGTGAAAAMATLPAAVFLLMNLVVAAAALAALRRLLVPQEG